MKRSCPANAPFKIMLHERIECARLDRLRRRIEHEGTLHLSSSISEAKLAIARSLGKVEVCSVEPLSGLGIQAVALPEHWEFMRQARQEAQKSDCWMGKVGTVVVDTEGQIVAQGHNHPVIPGKFCRDLGIDIEEVRKLLKPGERLDFCQNIHDVEGIVAEAARGSGGLRSKTWYLSLEPCDRCANHLVMVEPKAVYFSLGLGRERYYNSVGLERLVVAGVPTYFVCMPGEQII